MEGGGGQGGGGGPNIFFEDPDKDGPHEGGSEGGGICMKEIISPAQIIKIFEVEGVSGEGGQEPSLRMWHVRPVGVPTEVHARFQAGVG
jgi:hypothetical protein